MKNKSAQELGSIKTPKKSEVSRENGKRGGRPRHYYLHEIPRESRIKAEAYKAVEGPETREKIGDFITFHHVDGMYSYCSVEGKPKEICHLSVMQKLILRPEGYYELV